MKDSKNRECVINTIQIMIFVIVSLFFSPLIIVNAADVNNWDCFAATSFAGGDGSKTDPYRISNAEELAKLADDVSNKGVEYEGKYFALTNDIDLSEHDGMP